MRWHLVIFFTLLKRQCYFLLCISWIRSFMLLTSFLFWRQWINQIKIDIAISRTIMKIAFVQVRNTSHFHRWGSVSKSQDQQALSQWPSLWISRMSVKMSHHKYIQKSYNQWIYLQKYFSIIVFSYSSYRPKYFFMQANIFLRHNQTDGSSAWLEKCHSRRFQHFVSR